jgi:cGMP-dependent protein kinase
MVPKAVAKGETIIAQGAVNETFYLVKVGAVDVVTKGSDGKAQTVKSLSGGEYFGERSLLKGEPAVASIVATDATELMCLPKARFEELLGPMQAVLDRETARREAELKDASTVKISFADLDLRQVLGEGSFGCVRLVVHKASNAAYALKAMHKGHLISTNQVGNTVNEKRIMKMCDHPFILKCSGTFNQPKHVQLLLGLCPGGELFNLMSRVGTLKADKTAMYVAMVASALGFLSARNIAHRDLKLENLLFDDKGYLKLVDFGFAKVVESRTWTFCGTPDYLAPEILSHAGHNFAVDWWTLGILTYEMLHGEPPFCEDDQMATFNRISRLDYRVKPHVPAEAKDVITKLLVANPAKRLGMLAGAENDILGHKFCSGVDMAKLLKREHPGLPFVPKCKDPTDCSSFDTYPPPSSGKKFDKYLDKKHDKTWETEFGEDTA